MTKTTSKFYIASISNRNPLDGLVGAKIACLGIHMTTHSGAGLGVVMHVQTFRLRVGSGPVPFPSTKAGTKVPCGSPSPKSRYSRNISKVLTQ